MYVEDVKEEFYAYLSGKRVFLMVHYDVDSICACRILQTLLKHTHTVYTVGVVVGVAEMRAAFVENVADCKHFVLLNCGGTLDLVDLLQPDDDVVFFVLDAHRPTDLCNIFSNAQVRLLSSPDDDSHVPDFHDVFREESDDDDDEEEEVEEQEEAAAHEDDPERQMAKRRRTNDYDRRRERHLWEESRNRILFEYTQFSYYNKASALKMYELAWKLNKDDKELLWLAIVALSEQLLHAKIEQTTYVLEAGNLQAHVTRLQNRGGGGGAQIAIERDLRLMLYRHWTAEASIKYTPHTACRMQLWSFKGDQRLQELLADMGLPIAQSRQAYRSMDLQLRDEFQRKLHALADKYALDDVLLTTFTLQSGYRHKFAAMDVVYALDAILECCLHKTNKERFSLALECLSRHRSDTLYVGVERAKHAATAMFRNVQSALELRHVVSAGAFFYYIVQDGATEWRMYSQPHMLLTLAQFVLRAFVSVSKNRKAHAMPLIVSAPCDDDGDCVVLGIPPLCENSPKNFFGKAFEQAAEQINCETYCDYFDTAYFRLASKHRTRFFDALAALLS